VPPSIPLVSLLEQHAALAPQLSVTFTRLLASGALVLGEEVSAFESEIAEYLGARHAVGVSSGTDALVCALLALGVGVGDEVITTPYTFVATAEAIVRVGATPRFVDVEAKSLALDPLLVQEAIGPSTRAILPVHLFGHPADVGSLASLAASERLALIEDAAQAIGATWESTEGGWEEDTDRSTTLDLRPFAGEEHTLRSALDGLPGAPVSATMVSSGERDTLVGPAPSDAPSAPTRPSWIPPPGPRRVGTLGAAGCFSFFPSKPLGALGDGGLVVTQDGGLADRVRRLRQHGASAKHRYTEIGGNYRLDALQAAFLRVKLPHLDEWLAARRSHAVAYGEAFAGIEGLELPFTLAGTAPAWAHYVVRVKHGRRDEVATFLAERGIATAVYYPTPLHLQPAFAFLGHRAGDFPEAESAAAECLALPLYPELGLPERERVVAAVREALG